MKYFDGVNNSICYVSLLYVLPDITTKPTTLPLPHERYFWNMLTVDQNWSINYEILIVKYYAFHQWPLTILFF